MDPRLLKELQRVTILAESLVEHIHGQSTHPENNEVIMFDVDAIQYAKSAINEASVAVDTISIEKLEGGAFTVRHGDKWADGVAYDEMLGLVSALTMPESRPCLQWLWTKERHETWRKYLSPQLPELQPWQKLIDKQ